MFGLQSGNQPSSPPSQKIPRAREKISPSSSTRNLEKLWGVLVWWNHHFSMLNFAWLWAEWNFCMAWSPVWNFTGSPCFLVRSPFGTSQSAGSSWDGTHGTQGQRQRDDEWLNSQWTPWFMMVSGRYFTSSWERIVVFLINQRPEQGGQCPACSVPFEQFN